MTDNKISDLHPDLQSLASEFLAHYRALGRKIAITETWRDPARENQLNACGVTKATGLTCKHCFMIDGKPASKAFDFALYDEDGAYITDGTDAWYAEAGDIATSLGLLWGGNFVHAPKDWDHCEMID